MVRIRSMEHVLSSLWNGVTNAVKVMRPASTKWRRRLLRRVQQSDRVMRP